MSRGRHHGWDVGPNTLSGPGAHIRGMQARGLEVSPARVADLIARSSRGGLEVDAVQVAATRRSTTAAAIARMVMPHPEPLLASNGIAEALEFGVDITQ